jgi:uncharacterized RDD family membrane protein YckC
VTTQPLCSGCGREIAAHQLPFLGDAAFNLWVRERYCSYPCFRATATTELVERHEQEAIAQASREEDERELQPAVAFRRRQETSLVNAGVFSRVIARLVDIVFGIVSAYFAMIVVAAFSVKSKDPAPIVLPGELSEPAFLIHTGAMVFSMLVGSIILLTLPEWLFGTTPGKALFGVRVTTERGRRASFVRVFLREILFLFDAAFFGVVGFVCMSMTEQRQRLGDMIARTVVIRSTDERFVLFFKALGVVAVWCVVWGALMRLLVVQSVN